MLFLQRHGCRTVPRRVLDARGRIVQIRHRRGGRSGTPPDAARDRSSRPAAARRKDPGAGPSAGRDGSVQSAQVRPRRCREGRHATSLRDRRRPGLHRPLRCPALPPRRADTSPCACRPAPRRPGRSPCTPCAGSATARSAPSCASGATATRSARARSAAASSAVASPSASAGRRPAGAPCSASGWTRAAPAGPGPCAGSRRPGGTVRRAGRGSRRHRRGGLPGPAPRRPRAARARRGPRAARPGLRDQGATRDDLGRGRGRTARGDVSRPARVTVPAPAPVVAAPAAAPAQAAPAPAAPAGPLVRARVGRRADARRGPPGWKQTFTDDFTRDVPLGQFPAAASDKWGAYRDGWTDTTKRGTYAPSKAVSVPNGVLDYAVHTEAGVHLVGRADAEAAQRQPRLRADLRPLRRPLPQRPAAGLQGGLAAVARRGGAGPATARSTSPRATSTAANCGYVHHQEGTSRRRPGRRLLRRRPSRAGTPRSSSGRRRTSASSSTG